MQLSHSVLIAASHPPRISEMDYAFEVASRELKRLKVGLPGERATF